MKIICKPCGYVTNYDFVKYVDPSDVSKGFLCPKCSANLIYPEHLTGNALLFHDLTKTSYKPSSRVILLIFLLIMVSVFLDPILMIFTIAGSLSYLAYKGMSNANGILCDKRGL